MRIRTQLFEDGTQINGAVWRWDVPPPPLRHGRIEATRRIRISLPTSFGILSKKEKPPPPNCDPAAHKLTANSADFPSPKTFCKLKRNGFDADKAHLAKKKTTIAETIVDYFKYLIDHFRWDAIKGRLEPIKAEELKKQIKTLRKCITHNESVLDWLGQMTENCKKQVHEREVTNATEAAELKLASAGLTAEAKGVDAKQELENSLQKLIDLLRKQKPAEPIFAPCDPKKGPKPRPWCVFVDHEQMEASGEEDGNEICDGRMPLQYLGGFLENKGAFLGNFGARVMQ
eukprot:CAMPEP_0178993284 /NCGR_PEP_ID=MMETSP0795-20121207/6618_1 /TAXON_ID=88552 /ORGANISM="Amoebophrya sp., Strain Ameob2" /LENGTH=286 /DNA_ID=CAMNT_0020685327 /DNA_START=98 /DNA_END=958 /DNA_ORIENTATION=+